jgi:hypothetical protein
MKTDRIDFQHWSSPFFEVPLTIRTTKNERKKPYEQERENKSRQASVSITLRLYRVPTPRRKRGVHRWLVQ